MRRRLKFMCSIEDTQKTDFLSSQHILVEKVKTTLVPIYIKVRCIEFRIMWLVSIAPINSIMLQPLTHLSATSIFFSLQWTLENYFSSTELLLIEFTVSQVTYVRTIFETNQMNENPL